MLSLGTLDRKVRWSSVVVCWLGFGLGVRVRVRVRVRAGARARECTSCTFFSLSGLISCSEHRGSVVSISTQWFTYGLMSRC